MRLALGDRWLDLDAAVVRGPGADVALTDREVKLLGALVAAEGRPVPAAALVAAGWGEGASLDALMVALNRLRKKIEPEPDHPRYLRTLRNEGYALRADPLRIAGAERVTMLGRDAELRALVDVAGPGALVTVTGPGGAGKTTIARALLRELGDRAGPRDAAGAPEKTAFVELATARDLPDVVRLVAEATGTQLSGRDLDKDVAALGSSLGRWRAVVLDNAEQAADAVAAAVTRWRGSTTLVVTSRVVLGVPGEVRVALGPLSPEAARALFLRRAADVVEGFRTDDLAAVDGIVDRLDRLPLAILLCAGRVAVFAPGELLARLSRSLDVASDASAGMPDRHRGLPAAFEGSWELLDPGVRRVLGRLSVFPASFGVDDAEAVAGEPFLPGLALGASVLEALQTALDASLLRPPEAGRVALYEIVRQLVAARVEPGERREAELRHARWTVERVEAGLPELDREGAIAARAELYPRVPDLLAVVDRDVPGELVARAALAADAILAPQGMVDRRIALLDRALSGADGLVRARVRLARGVARDRKGLATAREDFEAALALARELGDRAVESDALREIGATVARLGQDALPWFAAAREAADAVGDEVRAGLTLTVEARWRCDHGDSRHGFPLLREAVRRLAATPDRRAESMALVHLGVIERVANDDAAADRAGRRAFELAELLGDQRVAASVAAQLGVTALDAGRTDEALERFARTRQLADVIGEPRYDWIARMHTVRTLVDRGEVDAALAEIGRMTFPAADLVAQRVYMQATAHARRGDVATARATLEAFRFDPARDHELVDLANALSSVCASVLGDPDGAEAALARPATWEEDLGIRAREVATAALAAARGDPGPARAVLADQRPITVDLRMLRRLLATLVG